MYDECSREKISKDKQGFIERVIDRFEIPDLEALVSDWRW